MRPLLLAMIGAIALLLSTVVASAQATYPSWSHTGNLNTYRYGHTATLLSDGKVLVFGSSELPSTNSAEVYDPTSGTWSTTGSLNFAFSRRTATLLPSGKVLVAGGVGLDNGIMPVSVNSAELYDPATGTWTTTGSLNTGRAYHTATLLPSGKVLVAGGQAFSGPLNYFAELNSAELYDPATGRWSYTGNLRRRLDTHRVGQLRRSKTVRCWLREVTVSRARSYATRPPGLVSPRAISTITITLTLPRCCPTGECSSSAPL